MKRESSLAGILEPVFAIRTEDDLGIGDTDGVRQMVDWCARHGLNIFQTLPINETGGDNSPYNAISSLALDPGTIAISPKCIPDLTPAKFKSLAPADLLAELREGPVNYAKCRPLKRALLEAGFDFFLRHWEKQTARGAQFLAFLRENAAWISDYALFRSLMDENGGTPFWESWSEEHRTPQLAHTWLLSLPEKRRTELARRQLFFCYVQWIASSQWRALKSYAQKQRVQLFGDIPFGVGRGSADAWANRDVFDLDWCGGAPPEKAFKDDPFTVKWGQNWGIPNYRWDDPRGRALEWWRIRIEHIRRNFHLYRIDHVLGFFRIYSFPWTPDRNGEFLPLSKKQAAAKTGGRLPGFSKFADDSPAHKKANQQRGERILRFVLEASGDTGVIAEDLGMVPDYVPVTLEKLGIPGFRIPNFLRERDGSYADPAKYARLSLAQPATHDHPPIAALWSDHWRAIDAGKNAAEHKRELQRFMDFAGVKEKMPPREFTDALREGYLRRVANGNSKFFAAMITDIFGGTERFNIPGAVSSQNWSIRISHTVNELDADPSLLSKTRSFSKVVEEAGRGP